MTKVHATDLEVLERLGGTRASVHRAVIRGTGRVVVVKHAPWDRTDAVAGLGREATVLARVQHPCLVRLVDTVEDAEGRTLVLAHAAGGNLEDRLAADGPLSPGDAADVGGRLASALAALHRAGVTHRDVQPRNVLIDAELLPILADLDHALDAHGEALPADAEIVGHPDHVDHRQFAGDRPGPTTDLHGLATTIWTAITGTPPPRDQPQDPVRLPRDPRVPDRLRQLLTACLDGSIGDAAAAASALEASAIELRNWVAAPASEHAPTTSTLTELPPPPMPGDTRSPEPRVTAIAGGGAGGSDAGTRRWGPRPDRPGIPLAAGVRRTGWLAIAMAVLLVPVLGLLWWVTTRDDERPAAVATVVTAPPLCDGTAAPPDGVAADLDGDGCSELLRLADGVLSTPAGSFAVGEPGDVLLAGDWDGDGRWSPGLYRPSTGEVFLFDAAPDTEALSSRPAEQRTAGGVAMVVDSDGDGRHEVIVTSAAT